MELKKYKKNINNNIKMDDDMLRNKLLINHRYRISISLIIISWVSLIFILESLI